MRPSRDRPFWVSSKFKMGLLCASYVMVHAYFKFSPQKLELQVKTLKIQGIPLKKARHWSL